VRLIGGTQLLGKVEGGAFTDPRYLVKRADSAMLQVSALIYFTLEALDGRYGDKVDPAGVAQHVSERCGRTLNSEGAQFLLQAKVAPLGLVAELLSSENAGPAGVPNVVLANSAPHLALGRQGPPPPARPTQMLGLRLRARVVPERVYRALTRALAPLFHPTAVVVALLALATSDAWGAVELRSVVLKGLRETITSPSLLLAMYLAVTIAAAFHELGHASAARYDGVRSGVMGIGIYILWPVFYTDVTETYRLNRKGRLRTDLGGVYFHAIAALVAWSGYLATGSPVALAMATMIQLTALYQFLPFIRFDGYYILSDFIGVPNLFTYVKVVLRQLVHGGSLAGAADMSALTHKARVAIKAWVLSSVLVLFGDLALTSLLAPTLFPGVWRRARADAGLLVVSAAHAQVVRLLDSLFGLVIFAALVSGFAFMVIRLGTKLAAMLSRSPFALRAASSTKAALMLAKTMPVFYIMALLALFSVGYAAPGLWTSGPARLTEPGSGTPRPHVVYIPAGVPCAKHGARVPPSRPSTPGQRGRGPQPITSSPLLKGGGPDE
jgi:putative peptide zinc metalloprotease protein